MRCGISTGAISSANTPFFCAIAASWCERAENASCASRVTFGYFALWFSVEMPMATWSKAHVSASKAIASIIVTSPYLKPSRDLGSRCGACVIDSMPPATTISNSPARMSWSASAIASRPDRQTLLIVSAGTSMEMPPLTAACRAVIWPAPAWITWPMIT